MIMLEQIVDKLMHGICNVHPALVVGHLEKYSEKDSAPGFLDPCILRSALPPKLRQPGAPAGEGSKQVSPSSIDVYQRSGHSSSSAKAGSFVLKRYGQFWFT
jgi:hypothetical protein